MSSRFQMALITRVVETGDLNPLRVWGITPRNLTDADAALLLEYVELHVKENGIVPRKTTIREKLPGVYFEETGEDPEILCTLVSEEIAEVKYRQLQLDSQDLLDSLGPIEAASRMQKAFMVLSSTFGKTQTHVLGSRADIEFNALTMEAEVGTKVPYVWPTLQLATGGARAGELIIIYGKRKQAKTWALLEQAEYVEREGQKVLVISPEMSAAQLARRTYAIRAEFPYHAMQTKSLFTMEDDRAAENMMRLRRVITSFLESSNFIIYDPRDEEIDLDITIIEGLIQEHKPDLLAIDQLQYIRTSHDPKKELRHQLGDTTKRLKKFARIYGIPIIATTQSNREGDIAESVQIEQIADLVIWIEMDRTLGIRKFRVHAAREIDVEDWACFSEFCKKMHEIPPGHPALLSLDTKVQRQAEKKRNPDQKKLRRR